MLSERKLYDAEKIRVETLDHHGITAGYIDKLKLVERIDARLPILKGDEAKLTHGQRVKAMIINGLGFTQNPIYLSPHFFEDKALSILIGEGVEAEHINADSLGRALDTIYDYGSTQLFAEIANEVSKEFMPTTSREHLHLDTTSLKVCGEYDVDECYLNIDSPPLPKHGHSKDHRPDLKQLMLSLTVSGPANLPVWYEGLDGNSQDKTNFHNTLEQIKIFRGLLEDSPEMLVIADSALYVKDKLFDALYAWITRVPENIKLVKQLVESNKQEFAWQELQEGYTGVWLGAVDRNMRQHWVMVYSEQAGKRETITLNKRIDKALLTAEKEVKKLANQAFACEKDAQQAVVMFEKKLKYHKLTYQIVPVTKFIGRGRPKKTELPALSHYQLQIQLDGSPEKQQPYRNKLGRFILATNDLCNSEMDAAALLNTYKEQQGVERGFRFIKDPQFHLNGIFLKKPERIDALMMIMTLCLMVYNVGQYEIREELSSQEETVLNQVGKPIKNPTLRWLFQRMNGINLVTIPGQNAFVMGLTDEKRKILRLFGPAVAQLYKLV
jgi:transposase